MTPGPRPPAGLPFGRTRLQLRHLPDAAAHAACARAWCRPDMLVDLSSNGCGIGMPLQLTAWGSLVKTYLQQA